MNGYEKLANAIILQAKKDYVKAFRRYRGNPFDRSAAREMREIESFFGSEWFMVLSGLDGPKLAEMIRRNEEQEHKRKMQEEAGGMTA